MSVQRSPTRRWRCSAEWGFPPATSRCCDSTRSGPESGSDEPVALVWADLLGQARVNARTAVRYLVFMAVAGVIAAFGVIDEDQILIVGAMAVSPDLLPVTAACTGLVLRRGRLLRQGLASLVIGLGVACAFAAAVTGLLDLFGLLPSEFSVHEVGLASQEHVEAETILVAFAAGVAGMLAVETRASMGVGVAISVTTIPAAAFLGVAAGIGERRHRRVLQVPLRFERAGCEHCDDARRRIDRTDRAAQAARAHRMTPGPRPLGHRQSVSRAGRVC